MSDPRQLLLLGCGAIGSRFTAALAAVRAALTCVDRDRVAPENLGVSDFRPADLGTPKASILAARWRASGAVAHALAGDLLYLVRPGLTAAVDAVVCCLDNPGALHDAAAAIWAGAPPGVPVLVLTCGGESRPGWLARLLVTPGACIACTFDRADREAYRHSSTGAGCSQTTAPRAAADSAQAAAEAGARLLARWLGGDRSIARSRLQDDGAGEFLARMPAATSRRCAVAHTDQTPLVALGPARSVTTGALAERALECAGHDAVIDLGRRSVPLGGLYCPACRVTWGSPPLLLPAALARPRPCACGVAPRPLGTRSELGARELLDLDGGTLGLLAMGASPGDEFVARGHTGQVRLRCTFDWAELEDHGG